jgi:hypothetical protein
LKVSDQLGILSSIFFFPYFLQSYARPHWTLKDWHI